MNNSSNFCGVCEKALHIQMNRNFRLDGGRHPFLKELDQRFYKSLDYIKYRPKKALSIDIFPYLKKIPQSNFFEKTVWTESSFLNNSINKNLKKFSLRNLIPFPKKKKVFSPGFENKFPFANNSFSYVETLAAISWSDKLIPFFKEINRLLDSGGLFGFASFGPETLKNFAFSLKNEVNDDRNTSFIPLIDLHDLGDFCVAAGFESPVVASDRVFFKYKKAETALKELRMLSGNPLSSRNDFLNGKKWYESIISALNNCRDANGCVTLEFELIYGHAWKRGGSFKNNKKEKIKKDRNIMETKIKFF